METKIIVVYNTESVWLNDISKIASEKVFPIDYYIEISRKNKFVRLIRTFLCSNKVNKYIKIPCKQVWSSLDKIKWENDTHYIVLFFGIYNKHLDPKYLLSLKSKYNIEFAICILDVWYNGFSSVSKYYIENLPFKYIFTFDIQDAKKYKFIYFDNFYSMLDNVKNNTEYRYDLYYNGRNKFDRIDFLSKICNLLDANNITSKLKLYGVKKQFQFYKNRIEYNEFTPYEKIVQEVLNANCILEFLDKGQSGATLRYYEAIC